MLLRAGRKLGVALLSLGAAMCPLLSGCGATRDEVDTPAPGHNWSQTHRVEMPSNWQVTARNVGLKDESTSLSGPGDQGCLVATQPGEPDKFWSQVTTTAVTVQGVEGTYGPADPNFGPFPRSVIWRAPSSQRWIRVSCNTDKDQILDMAERVRFEPNPMRLPFRLTAIPDGLTLTGLIESDESGRRSAAASFDAPGDPRPYTMEIFSRTNPKALLPSEQPVETQTINGYNTQIRKASQSICFPTRSDPVCIFGPADEPASDWSPPSRELALATARQLTPIEDPADETSWIGANEAIPR